MAPLEHALDGSCPFLSKWLF